MYEQLLDKNPGVARKGEGWASRNNVNLLTAPHPRSMGKTSSMLSLREKARAFLNVGDKVQVQEKDKRETLDLATFAPEDDNYHPDRGSKRQSGGKMVQWVEPSTTASTAATAAPRPGTPGALSTLSMSGSTSTVVPKKKGLFNFKWGKKEDA